MRSPRTPTKSSPRSLQLEKARVQQRRPNAAKKKKIKKNKFIYLFLAVLGLVAVRGLSLVAVSGGYSSLQCAGLSPSWLLVAEHGL